MGSKTPGEDQQAMMDSILAMSPAEKQKLACVLQEQLRVQRTQARSNARFWTVIAIGQFLLAGAWSYELLKTILRM